VVVHLSGLSPPFRFSERLMAVSEYSRCTCCGQTKPKTEFYKRGDSDRLRSHCKRCIETRTDNEARRARAAAWHATHPERAAELARKWRARHPEYGAQRWARNRDQLRAAGRAVYQRHRKVRIAKQVVRDRTRRTEIAAYRRLWWQGNPDKAAEYRNRRRAAKRRAGGHYIAEDIQALFEKQRGLCAYCREPLHRYHVDHVVALSKGGTNWPGNLCLACGPCNCSKRAKDRDEFMRERGFA